MSTTPGIISFKSKSWSNTFNRPVWLFVHFNRLSSKSWHSSDSLFALSKSSNSSGPITSGDMDVTTRLRTIRIEAIGERRSWAITEYILSRLLIVARNSSFCFWMRRFAATNVIWCITRTTSSSLLKGFVKKSLAPTWKPWTRSLGLFNAVRKMIGISAVSGSFFKMTAVSKPLMSGIITSSRIRSGFSAFACSMHILPQLAVHTWNFSLVSRILSNSTLLTTSSTIKIL